MSASRRPPSDLPGWTAIHSEEDLELHDPFDPAWLLIPAALVRPIWIWLEALTLPNDTGALCRGLEMLIVGLGEPDSQLLLSGTRQITASLHRLMVTAQQLADDDEVIALPADDGEEDLS